VHEVEFALGAQPVLEGVAAAAFADLAAMGNNMMARDRRIEVIEAARASTERTLRRIGRRRLGRIGLAAS
jgi:hypothetical protein